MPLEILNTDFEKADYTLTKAGITSDNLRQFVAEAIALERRETRRAYEQIAQGGKE